MTKQFTPEDRLLAAIFGSGLDAKEMEAQSLALKAKRLQEDLQKGRQVAAAMNSEFPEFKWRAAAELHMGGFAIALTEGGDVLSSEQLGKEWGYSKNSIPDWMVERVTVE